MRKKPNRVCNSFFKNENLRTNSQHKQRSNALAFRRLLTRCSGGQTRTQQILLSRRIRRNEENSKKQRKEKKFAENIVRTRKHLSKWRREFFYVHNRWRREGFLFVCLFCLLFFTSIITKGYTAARMQCGTRHTR